MAERKTEQSSGPGGELLRAMSQSQSRSVGAEVDTAMLMRLANDPLRLNAFLQRQSVETRLCRSSRVDADALLSYALQTRTVSLRELDKPSPVRSYGVAEPRSGSSLHAFKFTPSRQEQDMAWDGEVFASQETPIDTTRFRRPRLNLLQLILAGSILAFVLALSFG